MQSTSDLQLLNVSVSTNHSMRVDGHVPPKFDSVFNNVMYVPPARGSLTLAKNAM